MTEVDAPKIVIALNYYAPYVSGLTEVARIVAESLVAQGHRVTVVATQHDSTLPRHEVINGVDVIRTAVLFRIGKGVISPSFPFVVARESRSASVLNLHFPMIEAAAVVALVPRRVPIVPMYHCDVNLPPGFFNSLQRTVMDLSCCIGIARSSSVVVSSGDYASHSRLRRALAKARTVEIAPPTLDRSGGDPGYRDGAGLHIGFMGRLVEEKGVPYLIEAFRSIKDPDARLLIAGDFASVAGGSVIGSIREAILGDQRVRILGFLPEESIRDFFASLDAFALPSVNSLEAFGIVQVEAMRAGVPVVASDLPGVRIPVNQTGFGRVVAPRDVAGLATALIGLADYSEAERQEGAARASAHFSRERTVSQFLELFADVTIGNVAPVK